MDAHVETALNGALQLTDLRSVLDAVTEETYDGLKRATAGANSSTTEEERRKALLLHLHNTRQRLLRLLVVLQWTNKAKAVQEVSNVLDKASFHAGTFREAADQLFHQHNDPFLFRAPMHDVPTALDVLQTGGYDLLPSVIESLRAEPEPPPRKRHAAIQLMDQLLRIQLLKEDLPPGLRIAEIANGCATLRTGDEFEVRLILVPAPEPVLEQPSQAGEPAQSSRPPGQAVSDSEAQGTAASAEGEATFGEAMAAGESTGLQDAVGSGGDSSDDGKQQSREGWRWRIISLTILPGPRKDFWMTPSQTAYLQRGTDELMWRAADALAAQSVPTLADDSGQEDGREAGGQLAEGKPPGSLAGRAVSEAGTSVPGSGALLAAAEGVVMQGVLQKPLEVMQRVLRMTAFRLLILEAMAWAQRQVGNEHATWHGLLKRDKAKTLPMGGRVAYWSSINTITPAELQALAESKHASLLQPADSAAAVPGPALELGLDADSRLVLLHEPELRQVGEEGALGEPVALEIEMHEADLEAVLLQATASNAAIQLAGLQQLIRARADFVGNGGHLILHASGARAATPAQKLAGEPAGPQAQGGARGFTSGVLELLSGTQSLLCVSVQLTNGRLLLRQGAAFLENPEIAAYLRNEEAAKLLEKLFLLLCLRHRFVQLAAHASQWGLSQAPLPAKPFKVFMKANPLAPQFSSRHIMQLVFPPPPTLTDVLPSAILSSSTETVGRAIPGVKPELPLPSANAASPLQPRSSEPDAAQQPAQIPSRSRWEGPDAGKVQEILGNGGRGLQFSLVAELKTGMRWEFLLCVMSCDKRGVPLKVLKLAKVPVLQPAVEEVAGTSAGSKRKRETADGSAESGSGGEAMMTDGDVEGGEPQAESKGGKAGDEIGDRGETPLGREDLAELSEVVRWCRERMVWEQLWLHLQIMGVPFERGLAPFTPPTKRLRTNRSLPLAPSTPAESASLAAGPKPSKGPLGRVLAASHVTSHVTSHVISRREQEGSVSAERSSSAAGVGGLERRLWVRGIAALEQLEANSQLRGEDYDEEGQDVLRPHIEFSVTPVASALREEGSWDAEVVCDYLARLPESCGGCAEAAEQPPEDSHIARTSDGLLLSYSAAAGGTAGTALRDIGRVARLHAFLARFNRLAAAQHPPPAAHETLNPKSRGWEVPASGRVELSAVGPLTAALDVFAAGKPAEKGQAGGREELAVANQESGSAGLVSVELRNPRTPPSTVFEDSGEPEFVRGSEAALEQLMSQQGGKDPRRLSDLFDGLGSNDGFSLDSVDLQQFRTHQSVLPSEQLTSIKETLHPNPSVLPAANTNGVQGSEEAAQVEGAAQARASVVAQESQGLASGEESRAARLLVEWRAGNSLESQAGDDARGRLRCRLTATPPLAEPVLDVLAEMADAGEEEVFLDALCICIPTAVILAASLSTSSLARAGLRACSVVLRWPRPPYRAQLLIQMHDGACLLVAFHFFANSVVWLGLPDLQGRLKSAPAGPCEASVQVLLARLVLLPGVRLPEPREAAPPEIFKEEGKPQASNGVWCRVWALEQALGVVLRFAGKGDVSLPAAGDAGAEAS